MSGRWRRRFWIVTGNNKLPPSKVFQSRRSPEYVAANNIHPGPSGRKDPAYAQGDPQPDRCGGRARPRSHRLRGRRRLDHHLDLQLGPSGRGRSASSRQDRRHPADSKSSARWETADRKYLEEAFKAAGVEYDIQNAQGDKTAFQTIADQMITNGVTVLMIVNLDSGTGKAVLDKAKSQGVATIDYDRLTLGGGAAYYVSFDNEARSASCRARAWSSA